VTASALYGGVHRVHVVLETALQQVQEEQEHEQRQSRQRRALELAALAHHHRRPVVALRLDRRVSVASFTAELLVAESKVASFKYGFWAPNAGAWYLLTN
jgi:hypothetical protein